MNRQDVLISRWFDYINQSHGSQFFIDMPGFFF